MADRHWVKIFLDSTELSWEERSLIQHSLQEVYTARLRVVFFHHQPALHSEQQEWKRQGRWEWKFRGVPKAYLDKMLELAVMLDRINPQFRDDASKHLGWREDGTPYFLEPYFGNGRIFSDEYGKDIPESEYESWPYHKSLLPANS